MSNLRQAAQQALNAMLVEHAIGVFKGVNSHKLPAEITALHAALAEPERKPLTDEEVRGLADKHLFYQPEGYEVSGIFNFARAIERAHGIGEQHE